MEVLINAAVIILSFCFMECVAWVTHKYIMHGLLWILHRDHHQGHEGFFERNDWFFLIFAFPSFFLMYFGVLDGNDIKLYMGIGIAAYGSCYFLVHDVFIHQRFRFLRNSDNRYLRAVRRAHKMHHKHLGKEEGECFGMLLVPFKYFKDAK